MDRLLDQLSRYAAYHRDRRNIATHFVGVPMIVVAVAALLARPMIMVGPVPVCPTLFVVLGSIAFYLSLDLRFGLVMGALMALATWAGLSIAAHATSMWLALGLGLFVVGWVIQFIGHAYEGKKPAFVDDLVGLLLGPLFVVAELGFALGLRTELLRQIEASVGPTLIRSAERVTASR